MTAPSEHEAYLRAALHAAADSLEPRGDGLERIRTRLQHARPMVVVWMTAAWDELRLRTPAAAQDAFYRRVGCLQDETFRFHQNGEDFGGMCVVGSFAEYSVLSEWSCVKIEDYVPMELAALVSLSTMSA